MSAGTHDEMVHIQVPIDNLEEQKKEENEDEKNEQDR